MSEERVNGENQSVARAIAILDLLADCGQPLGVREIARRLALPPSNVQRLIKSLTRPGYLEQADATQRYAIGYRAFQMGNAFVGQSTLSSAVMPELYRLADEHITGFLGVLRDRSVVYLATVQSEGPVAINHRPGHQTHLHSTAMGKALLAELGDDEVSALLGSAPLPRITETTKVELPQLLEELREIRRVGYSMSNEENRQGFFSAGAVVRDATDRSIAVISGSAPTLDLKPEDRTAIGARVLEAAQRASRKLGAPQDSAVGRSLG